MKDKHSSIFSGLPSLLINKNSRPIKCDAVYLKENTSSFVGGEILLGPREGIILSC